LPEGEWRIELIDVWRMTRLPVMAAQGGHVKVPLPGAEGIAVLATRV
jgi:hypothetical protein